MIQLINDNMFNTLKDIDSQSIDLLLTDFPYGTLNKRNVWDTIIDYPTFWNHVDRICKPTCAIISTAAQPFTSVLISSNYNDFKYTMVWEKSKATGYLNAKKQPLRAHEDIVVFYKKPPTYNPQMTQGTPYDKGRAVRDTESYGVQTKEIHVKNDTGLRYPRSVLYFKTAESEGKYHPTQKPLSLYEYLFNTYSNENDIVLDPCMGSGTTGVACMNTDRNFIGIEMDSQYYQIAKKRTELPVPLQQLAQDSINPLLDALQ
jgi:site-specific DNA-methyltransferase (adenine-specific)